MNMKMRDTFPTVWSIINNQPETEFMQTFLSGDGLCNEDQVAEKRLIFDLGSRDTRYFLFRNDQNVDRCLGLDVVESQTKIVLMDDPGWNFTGDDLGENRAHNVMGKFGTGLTRLTGLGRQET